MSELASYELGEVESRMGDEEQHAGAPVAQTRAFAASSLKVSVVLGFLHVALAFVPSTSQS